MTKDERRIMAGMDKAERKAFAGIARCNHEAAWYSPSNGYQVCDKCSELEPERVRLLALAEAGPGPFGRCDRPMDGMGTASWSERLSRAKCHCEPC